MLYIYCPKKNILCTCPQKLHDHGTIFIYYPDYRAVYIYCPGHIHVTSGAYNATSVSNFDVCYALAATSLHVLVAVLLVCVISMATQMKPLFIVFPPPPSLPQRTASLIAIHLSYIKGKPPRSPSASAATILGTSAFTCRPECAYHAAMVSRLFSA